MVFFSNKLNNDPWNPPGIQNMDVELHFKSYDGMPMLVPERLHF